MDQISQIKQNLDIVTVVGSYVQLKKSGKNYKGVCPFHSENTPSFMVSPELQMYKCFGCGAAGDIFQFIQQIEGIDFPSAMEKLADRAGIKLEKTSYDPDAKLKKEIYWINEQAGRFFHYLLVQHPAGKPGLDYLTKVRKLSPQTINNFLLGFAPDSPNTLYKYFSNKQVSDELLLKAGLVIKKDEGGYMDKFRGRIMFPLTGVDGKVLGFTGRTLFDRTPKYLNSPETPVFYKSSFVYALDKAKIAIKKQGAVLVEGQMDVISAHEAGITNVIAASGTALTQLQLKLLSRYTNDLIFCFDSDTAGVGAAFRGIELAENLGFNIKVAVIPNGYKDLDELVKASVDQAKQIFTDAVPAYDYLLLAIIKKHNKTSPEGKKKIMDELVPWFSRIKSTVLLDHYSKEISKELGLNVETVTSALKTGKLSENAPFTVQDPAKNAQVSQQSLESYIITLLFKGGLDFVEANLYKVDLQAYSDEKLKELLNALGNYLSGGSKSGKKSAKMTEEPSSARTARRIKQFDPKKFRKTLSDELSTLFDDIYLYEVDEHLLSDEAYLEKEFDTVLFRLKSAAAKRRMQELSLLIREAEKSNDIQAVKTLTAEFEQLKNLLVEK